MCVLMMLQGVFIAYDQVSPTPEKIPDFALCFGGRTFSCYASALWNSLDISVRNSCTLSSFKTGLKTLLYRECYFVERL